MLTAESIVGKIVNFIVAKTIGKIISLPFDKRRKACRSLTKLYYSIQCLDDVTENFLGTIDGFQKSGNARAVVNALNNHAHEVELATNMFVDLGHELHGGLEIIDPALAACCSTLYIGKFDFLTFMSNSIHWDRSYSPNKVLIKIPLGKMESVDMESMYQGTTIALQSGEKHYWPSSMFDEFSSDFEELSVSFETKEAATKLHEMVVRQNAILKEAKESLRCLIKDSFSIEEVLFQSDSHPYR